VNLADLGELAFEFAGLAKEIEGGGAGMPEEVEERGGLGLALEQRLEEGGKVLGVVEKGGFGLAGVGGGVAEAGGVLGGEGVVVFPEEAGGHGGGFHFGEDRAKGGGEAGAGEEGGFLAGEAEMKEGGVGNRFHGDKDAVFPWDGLIEGVDGGMIDAGHGADGLGEDG
jgi:hypothetical protein